MSHMAAVTMGNSLATINTPWSDISVVSPATQANNEDRQLSWGGGSRTIKNNWAAGIGTLEYRLDAGSWTTYTEGGAGFSMTSGQTLAWRMTTSTDITLGNAVVSVNGIAVDTFTIEASGFA